MIIDCHAHLVPSSLLDAIRKDAASFPSLRLVDAGGGIGFSFAGGKPTRPVSKPLIDVAGRLKWMDEQGIERQVVGGWLDMFGNELPAEEGDALVAARQQALWRPADQGRTARSFRSPRCRCRTARAPREVLREAHAAWASAAP